MVKEHLMKIFLTFNIKITYSMSETDMSLLYFGDGKPKLCGNFDE
jgi:hypothetical protein